ncbi:MAG: LuxR C-terminal-related transcriptional regulator [Rhodococcus sp. (in: high G+C Gram-positive bacteria)]
MTSLDERSALDSLLSAHDYTALAVLALASVGLGPDPYLVADVTSTSLADASTAIERARGCGVLPEEGAMSDSAVDSLRAVMGPHGLLGVLRKAVHLHLDNGDPNPAVSMALVQAGVRDPRLAEHVATLAASADRAGARALWDAASAAGATSDDFRLSYAEACVADDDLDTATRAVDPILSAEHSSTAHLRGAVRIAATVAMMRGTASYAAELYRWLGADRVGPDAAYAVTALLAVGDASCVTHLDGSTGGSGQRLENHRPVAPTTANARSGLVARGLLDSLSGSSTAAMGSVLRAISMSDLTTEAQVEPEHPTALAALLALHTGDPMTAKSVLSELMSSVDDSCGVPSRCRLLLAWTALMSGDSITDHTSGMDPSALAQRDALSYFALRIASARRRGDVGELAAAWHDARRPIAEAEPDLFSLIPLGELWLAAIRLGDAPRIAHSIASATALVAALGEPPTWATTWHWYGVQAAILGNSPTELLPHARALGSFAERSPYAAALASAGKAWLRVLQGEPDVAEVETCARTIEKFGHPWDAARLASDAALRVENTKDATALLQIARDMGKTGSVSEQADPSAATAGSLTEREAEVAHHLVLGLTYREIGGQMFISAKTVEHHVARIRRRIGAQSRSQMLSMLRAAGYAGTPDRHVHV